MPKVMCLSLNAEEGPHAEIFQSAGFEVEVVSRDIDLFQPANLIRVLGDAEAVLAGSEPYPAEVIDSLPQLRVIARTGVGYDAIDVAACDRAGVVVTTTPGVNHHAVAEHTIALLMGVARGFPDRDRRVRENRWKRTLMPRVMGRTLGLVGLGRIGRAVATRGVGLGLHVAAYEPFPDEQFLEEWNVELQDFDDLLASSDFLSLHLPMSAENQHLINAETLAKMKPGSVLINTARGALVDEAALAEALQSGHLRGAGLDVFETEPLPLESPLIECESVLLSGHVAGLDEESHNDTFAMAARTVLDLYKGRRPTECIQNRADLTDWSWQQKTINT